MIFTNELKASVWNCYHNLIQRLLRHNVHDLTNRYSTCMLAAHNSMGKEHLGLEDKKFRCI